ncbi:sodium/potassium/calcium exchanger 5-like isoform X2 [Oppia nitens]|uniref:sodium/potassium/calcium exchanger 5-like isoform X2 n=1 Tax=Oppia nitens TaxID=1686743 RepID=UPI0023DB5180|nr:sodium/potassium/calcium exchanger 5-like isoform X2 [Oppia nitens]
MLVKLLLIVSIIPALIINGKHVVVNYAADDDGQQLDGNVDHHTVVVANNRPPVVKVVVVENVANFRRRQLPSASVDHQQRQKRAVSVNIRQPRDTNDTVIDSTLPPPQPPTITTTTRAFNLVGKQQADSLAPLGKNRRNTSRSANSKSKSKNQTNVGVGTVRTPLDEFPSDYMSDEFRSNGGFIIHIIVFIYFCLALAIVCDVYFLQSLEYISNALSLPDDIAGATFMAIGTSAPELFTSVIGVFISDNDIGTGTIVGSAVFNLIAIPGCCGFAAHWNLKRMPKIKSFPILRDMIFYVLTVITLILCIKDNKVDWVESLTLLALYAVYIVIMFFNAQYSHLISGGDDDDVDEGLEDEEVAPLLKSSITTNGSTAVVSASLMKQKKNQKKSSIEEDFDNNHLTNNYNNIVDDHNNDGGGDEDEDYSRIELTKTQNGKYREIKSSKTTTNGNQQQQALVANNNDVALYPKLPVPPPPPPHHHQQQQQHYQQQSNGANGGGKPNYNSLNGGAKVEDNDDGGGGDWTDHWLIRTLLFPMTVLFAITLPKATKYCFVVTFLMSIVWIAALTYVVVWMTTVVGYTIGIPDTVSGITILAAGTSIPELISSYLIVKKAGLANMAICNSIGSNIFDILFCLGVPWLLKSLIMIITSGSGFQSLANTSIPIQSQALPLTSLTLLITCAALLISLKLSNWRLNLRIGIICTIVYVGFVTVSTVLEINV